MTRLGDKKGMMNGLVATNDKLLQRKRLIETILLQKIIRFKRLFFRLSSR